MSFFDKYRKHINNKPSKEGIDADALWASIEKELDDDVVIISPNNIIGNRKLFFIFGIVVLSTIITFFIFNNYVEETTVEFEKNEIEQKEYVNKIENTLIEKVKLERKPLVKKEIDNNESSEPLAIQNDNNKIEKSKSNSRNIEKKSDKKVNISNNNFSEKVTINQFEVAESRSKIQSNNENYNQETYVSKLNNIVLENKKTNFVATTNDAQIKDKIEISASENTDFISDENIETNTNKVSIVSSNSVEESQAEENLDKEKITKIELTKSEIEKEVEMSTLEKKDLVSDEITKTITNKESLDSSNSKNEIQREHNLNQEINEDSSVVLTETEENSEQNFTSENEDKKLKKKSIIEKGNNRSVSNKQANRMRDKLLNKTAFGKKKVKEVKIPGDKIDRYHFEISAFSGFNSGVTNFKSSSSENSILTNRLNNLYKNHFGNSVSLRINQVFHSRQQIIVSTGISYTSNRLKFKYSSLSDSLYVNENNILVDGNALRNIVNYNRFKQINVPLALGTRFEFKKLTLDLMFLGQLNYTYNQRGTSLNENSDILYFTNESEALVAPKFSYGIGIEPNFTYQLSESFGITFKPSILRLNNTKTHITNVTLTNWHFDFSFGIRYFLQKEKK